MMEQFFMDLEAAKPAERIVRERLAELMPDWAFQDVSTRPECYYKGDIRAIAPDGSFKYIEVKCDSRIADTHNVLCEYGVYYKNTNSYKQGNMSSKTDIYCVVSQSERTIYVINFKVLKEIYKKGRHTIIHHDTQDTYCHLLPLDELEAVGALKVITY